MALPASDEPALLARAQAGDREAFAALVTRHAPRVLSASWRILGDRALAEDVAQETFLSAFLSLSSFRADARFSTWLYRIAVNKCRDLLRSRAVDRQRSASLTGEGEDFPAETAGTGIEHRTPEAVLRGRQQARQLEQAIGRLAPLYREAFVLRHVEGLSYEEMSEALGADGATLRMRVYKARKELSQELASLAEA
jgi:RNA polymerase sigma-70 factor, ECF subfamily